MRYFLKKIKSKVSSLVCQFLRVDHIRLFIGSLRLKYFALTRGIKSLESDNAFELTIFHNMKSVKNHKLDFLMPRMNKLILPLLGIETVFPESSILVIGPRTENDLLRLFSWGFKNVKGLDLISYSPLIDLGDMHSMPYEDSSFDVIICGWTISYSKNPEKAASEMIRVIKSGGIIGIAVDFSNMSPIEAEKKFGYSIEPTDGSFVRLNSAEQIYELFGDVISHIYFCNNAPLRDNVEILQQNSLYPNSTVVTIFSISKE
ncbi:class I SAM-dependent methyltransferase [Thermosynechococcus sp. PP45]|uniref:class I SAM-dependent methyltransferase n=1 Tax=unclassified Thermosynechococcus TaxID=2622553 RepID=UPI0026710E81|nr:MULTISPECIES: class I SAM-dependent methyltransferase [unclassified Thermosynechococcus]MDR7992076.1 class I SAM-dependent methyltransferase [Thermosynechococcus sp. TG252]WKT81365.1 class I SAM-dependent methyltransferase [Thermosynechococcus sp. PP45]WNC24977.1 class I SAM-dependent methyltransferase [Thermosynechococcus sp. PP551]WNC27554.1 class I SAM-dependent methyltransferase [Thermosynechococcus sp. PP555]